MIKNRLKRNETRKYKDLVSFLFNLTKVTFFERLILNMNIIEKKVA